MTSDRKGQWAATAMVVVCILLLTATCKAAKFVAKTTLRMEQHITQP